ncbi:helix-turn-helix domain-containing protein [Rhizobium sp. BR 315]|nr:helix-turn-helix domain-containing protein [Rhizobium miluonense]
MMGVAGMSAGDVLGAACEPVTKQGKVKGVRFDTLERICCFLECQPGDILRYDPDDPVE